MTHSRWLLILDNVDDVQVIDNLLSASNGHILLTTRIHALAFGKSIEVKEMMREEGTLFLLRRAGLLEPDASLDAVSQEDRAEAQAIVDEVHGLPLAIDQVGAYIREVGCRVSEYRRLYADEKRHRQELLSRRGSFPSDHPESVTSTFLLSFQKIEQADPAAADLLRFFAFLSPDAIPEELIQGGLGELGGTLQKLVDKPLQLNEAIAKLRNYSLVHRDRNSQAFTIHRLVQIAISNTMDEDTQRQWAGRTVRAINRVFPEVNEETRKSCGRLLPQARECFELISKYHLQFPESAYLLYRVASFLRSWLLEWKSAEVFFLHALEILEQELGPKHIEVGKVLHGLALVYRRLNKYEKSEALYLRSKPIYEQQLGRQAPETLEMYSDLAYLYYKQGKYELAASLHQQNLAIREQVFSSDAKPVSTSLNNLALVYTEQGKYEEAEALYIRALDIRRKIKERSLSVAVVLDHLGELYQKQRKYEQAETCYQQAIAMREERLGINARGNITFLKHLADLYQVQDKYREAERLYQRAYSIWQKFGLQSRETVDFLEHYADLLRKMRRKKEAMHLETEAKAVREEIASQEESH